MNQVEHTVAIDRAVSAWLLAIALDFLSSTLITGTGHTPPLLHGSSGFCIAIAHRLTRLWTASSGRIR